MKDRKLTPPFLIQMTCGDYFKHCDVLPHGSFHRVQKDEQGILWLSDRNVDSVPSEFSVKIVDELPEIKLCPCCKNKFPKNWKFIMNHKSECGETCVRCFEKYNIVNREEYREALREELKLEIQNNDNI